MTILYVDDEEDLLKIGKIFLESKGFKVETALSAEDGLQLIKEKKYEAIVSDYQMPEMNGIEFLIKVRSCYGSIPFILFTGRGREEVVIQAINNGVTFYLQKGGDPRAQFAELAHKLNAAISRRSAEDELKLSNAILSIQLETSINGVLIVNEEEIIILMNKRFIEMWGIPENIIEDKSDKPVLKFVTNQLADPDEFLKRVRYLYDHKDEKSNEDIFLKDGRTFSRYSAPMIGKDGTYFGRLWDFRDITERKRAVDALKLSEEKYSTIYNQSPIAIEFYDLNGSLVEVNKACLEMFGVVDKNEISGFKLFEDPNISDAVKARLLNGEHIRFESEFSFEEVKRLDLYATTKTGKLYLDWNITPLTNNENGKLVGYMEQIQDITDRVTVEQELKDRQERYLQVFKTSADCIFVTMPSGRILDFNDATMRMFGYSDWKDLIKVNMSSLYADPEDRPEHLKYIQQNGGHAEDFPVRFKRKDGSTVKTLVTTVAVKRPDGSIKEFVGSIRVVE